MNPREQQLTPEALAVLQAFHDEQDARQRELDKRAADASLTAHDRRMIAAAKVRRREELREELRRRNAPPPGPTRAEKAKAEKAAKRARAKVTKIWRLPSGEVISGTGTLEGVLVLLRWYRARVTDGAIAYPWPERQQQGENWSRLIIARPDGSVVDYCREEVEQPVEDPFMAWGSGGDVAIGALAMGATARQAVEVACLYDASCGNGVDAFDVRPRPVPWSDLGGVSPSRMLPQRVLGRPL